MQFRYESYMVADGWADNRAANTRANTGADTGADTGTDTEGNGEADSGSKVDSVRIRRCQWRLGGKKGS